ncbi:MAG: aminomethyltransferase family protein, partial [Pseudomonadota bacterium]
PHVPSLEQLKWFGVTVGRVKDREGAPFLLSRTGYTGELGYELFCAESDALTIWDALMEAGEEHGLTPMGSAALETIRIEAGLASAHEFTSGSDAFEAGLGFAVDLSKADFVGKDALARNSAAPRKTLRGLMFECDDVPLYGAPVFAGERQVGVVTSATRSPMFERAIAMARLSVEHADIDTVLEVGQLDGRMKRLTARVTSTPFFDPKRERARA